jgi:uncharacterized protein YwgA
MDKNKELPVTVIGPRDILLLLIGVEPYADAEGLGGITRIQKLLYLLDAEEGIKPGSKGFEFEAYKAGPYSSRIYDDLEFLENLDFIRRSASRRSAKYGRKVKGGVKDRIVAAAEATAPERAEVDLTFEQLMGPEDVMTSGPEEIVPTADSYEEVSYTLTEKGKAKVGELMANPAYKPFVDGIRRVKSRFSKYSLSDLLYYVYTRHPDMTTESEIKEKVLRRRPT